MDNHKRMMLYCLLDAILLYLRTGEEFNFLFTDELDKYLERYELDMILTKDVRRLTMSTPLEVRSKMRLIQDS